MQYTGLQMNKFCVDLKLEIEPLSKNYDPYSPNIGHSKLAEQHVSSDFITFINSLDLILRYIEIFVKPSHFGPGIHIDDGNLNDIAKINWVYGGSDSIMRWYKEKPNTIHKSRNVTTAINSYAVIYPTAGVDLIHEQKVGFPSIIQAAIPHGVVTLDEPRYCYSAVMGTKTKPVLTFNEMLDKFSKYLAEGTGFEPVITESKSVVLPLH